MRWRGLLFVACGLAAVLSMSGCGDSRQNPMNTPAPRPIIATAPAQVSWQGQVDDSATIYFQAGKSWTDNVTKKGVEDVTATFDTPLPAAAVTVTLTGVSGRGQVNVVQQPTRDNNYTAGVRIVDHDPGSSGYKFVLSW